MKNMCWLIFAAFLPSLLFAQQATNAPGAKPIETPAAAPAVTNAAPAETVATNAPVAKAKKKKAGKTKAAATEQAKRKALGSELKSVPLVAGPAVVIASNVNIRGQAGLKGEVLGKVQKEQPVTVLEEVTLKKSAPDEPSAWARILLPTNLHVWVSSELLEGTNKTVKARHLNVRAGPGENYSVLGRLKRGDEVKELGTKGDWTEIEPPADAYAFVAAQYLKQESPGTPVATTEPAPAPTTVTEPPTVAAAPTENPAPTAPTQAPDTNAPAATNAPETNAPATPAVEEPPPRRIVQREGIVRGTVSIQAPTSFELASPQNGRTINYLYSNSSDLDLRRYKGLRIVVTGEESLDERWRNTPVITIQKIQVIE